MTLAEADRITEDSLTHVHAVQFSDVSKYIQSVTVTSGRPCADCSGSPDVTFVVRYGDFRKVYVCQSCAGARRAGQFS